MKKAPKEFLKPFWLSFAEESDRGRFLGVCLVMARDSKHAMDVAWVFGCNPGGEVQIMPVPDEARVSDRWFYRILTRPECELFDRVEGK